MRPLGALYCGPTEWIHRLMAGRPVTAEQYLTDGSDWTIAAITRWQSELIAQALECPECGRCNMPMLHAHLCTHGRARTALRAVSARTRERIAGHGLGCGCWQCLPDRPGITPLTEAFPCT